MTRAARSACAGGVLVAALLFALAEESARAQATATAPVVVDGKRYELVAPTALWFRVPTSGGELKGKVDVVRLELRGAEGYGRFDLRVEIDTRSVATGDAVVDEHLERVVLAADRGPLLVGATEKIAPAADPSTGELMPGARAWLDARRGGRGIALRYRFTPEGGDRARLTFRHTATTEELGLPDGKHPFVRATGPVEIAFDGVLVRKK